jgi:hypothetical protein
MKETFLFTIIEMRIQKEMNDLKGIVKMTLGIVSRSQNNDVPLPTPFHLSLL